VRDQSHPAGDEPPRPTVVPFYLGQYLTWAAGLTAVVAAIGWIVRRGLRRRR
jgi:hypothetical protein